MVLPDKPVTLTPEQVAALNAELSQMRHDVRGHLAVILAVVELVRLQPAQAQSRVAMLAEQNRKIIESMERLSVELERTLNITR
jgi:hypothetical protein